MNARDVLHAWRDFECSFFAGALLAPKVPFRRFLARESYRVEAGEKIQLTPAVVMRRMTKVSPYPYWHFFDAYPPGYLRAVYRGNGIPLPWGNMAQVTDPCPNWAVFRMLERGPRRRPRLADLGAARRRPVPAVLLPLPADRRHGGQSPRAFGRASISPRRWARTAWTWRRSSHPSPTIACITTAKRRFPRPPADAIPGAAKVLNIAWVEEALADPARIICPRSTRCPRSPHCDGARASRARDITDVREEIVSRAKRGR